MNNLIYKLRKPENETVISFDKNTEERRLLLEEIQRQSNTIIDIPLIIGGKEIKTGDIGNVVMPHNHSHVLATYHKASEKEIKLAINAAKEAKKEWMSLSWMDRISVMLKAAELITSKYRYLLDASTMLGQSKNPYQAEIDAVCETADFLRFNSYFLSQVYNDQPFSSENQLNYTEYRPLEGFVFAVTPFNFTSIASNLNMAVALMGNTLVWKPSTTSLLSNYYLMKIFKEAGLPDGVINFVPGKGSIIGEIVLSDKDLGGIHFTGSTKTFNSLQKQVSNNLETYKSYPKIIGETGGKNFIFVHETAESKEVSTAIIRGAFEFQGQKCSAASRAYIPKTLWPKIKELLIESISKIKLGDINDFSNFMNAVIDKTSFDNIMSHINYAKESKEAEVIIGGKGDKSKGYYIEPTVILTSNPHFKTMEEEIFGPVITIYIYNNSDYEETLKICDTTSKYALTGSIFSKNKEAIKKAYEILRYAAGNFYINDKPTGAVVGQQPFGGARSSGTNDKAGSYINLLRWTSPRVVKETFVPATCFKYKYME
ncbi:MAG: L-glutamate gamma-semialdehyde dehydrogenase [Bacteroidetes bacterium]|nr:L-glutamate gamma-semialdehyde dehydrogenase [Bacteroidota bacterium]